MDDSDNVASLLPTSAGQLFMPRTHRQALAELVHGIRAGEPFVALTGKPGVGKTTVLNTAVAVLAEGTLRISRIDNPDGTPLRLPQIIGELLGNPPGAVTNEDVERLFDTLTSNNDGDQLVLVFDDAQCLQPDVLGYLQIVSSLHALGIRHQQVIFTGRPEFWSLLKDPKLCDLVERIKVRPVIESLCEAEAREFLCYRLDRMFGPISQHVPDAALSRLIHYGDGIPGRLEPILMKSLVVAGGCRELQPETVDAAARTVASAAPSVVVPAAPERSSSQMVASHPPPASIPRTAERRRPVLYPGALVCLAVLLAGGIGTAWHSSAVSNPREISGPATAASTSLPEPPTRTTVMLAVSAPSQTAAAGASDSSAPAPPGLATSSRVDTPVVTVPAAPMPVAKQQPAAASAAGTSTPVTSENQEASPAVGSLSPGAGMSSGQDMSSPLQRAGVALTAPDATSPAHGSSSPADAVARSAQPQSSSEAPASPPAAVAPPSTATTAAVPQPPTDVAAFAAPQPAPASPRATDAVVPSTQSPTASVAPPASTAAAVAAQTTEPTDGQAQPPNAPLPSATTPSAIVSSPSTTATPRSAQSEHMPAAPAASPQVSMSPASTEPAVPATQRNIAPNSVTTPLQSQTPPPAIAATAPAAPAPAVSVNPAPSERSATLPAGGPVSPAPRSGDFSTTPADTRTAQPAPALPTEVVAELVRRGDAMLAIGDISSARLLYGRAAESGDARATTQLGKTYDPSFLAQIGAWSVPTDATIAARWYRKAMALGDAEAAAQLKRLGQTGQ